MSVRIINGDCLDEMKTLPDESVHCCVTSPPYWGLRDYGTATWEGGDADCEHRGRPMPRQDTHGAGIEHGRFGATRGTQPSKKAYVIPVRAACRCGATRVDAQLGLEASPAEYVEKIVAVFREARRVLRDDGTLWLNLGDSYSNDTKWGGSSGGKNQHSADGGYQGQRVRRGNDCDPKRGPAAPGQPYQQFPSGLKPKDLVGIPWRVAFALQADGWYLRQDIIWAKPNAMPESVRDRCTKSHEYLFLLAKSEKYYCDMESIKEPSTEANRQSRLERDSDKSAPTEKVNGIRVRSPAGWKTGPGAHGSIHNEGREQEVTYAEIDGSKRNKRSVWTVATQPLKEAHFATFPPALIEPCILAGCPVGGTVLDPFGGAGTTGLVADRLQRDAILIELNGDYSRMAAERIRKDSSLFAEVAA